METINAYPQVRIRKFSYCSGALRVKKCRKSPSQRQLKETAQMTMMLALIVECLRSIEERLNQPPAIAFNWITSEEVCTLLGVSKRTLSYFRETGMLPYSKLGGKVYFQVSDIDDFLKTAKVTEEQRLTCDA